MGTKTTKNKIQPGDGDERHGTINGYTNHACRCNLCREANRVRMADYFVRHPEQQVIHSKRETARYHRNKANG